MPAEIQRPDPEALLRQVQAEEEHQKRGRLKVFFGYASGTGKSFRMFDEGRRRRERGQDVAVGAVQPNTSPAVEEVLRKLEVIPPRIVEGVPVVNVEAILSRRPQICLVDGLAYDNAPGSRNLKRWQDIEELLTAGITVITSVNLQFIEEKQDQVEKIVGKRVSQTVPMSFLSTADEIVIVDAPPELALQRAADPNMAARGQKQLSELREIALLLAADIVDRQLERYLQRHGIQPLWGAHERILVCVTAGSNAASMIESGRRNAERFHGDLFVISVSQASLAADDRALLDQNLLIAQTAGAHVETLEGDDPIDSILQFARAHRITQIFVGHSRRESWWERLSGNPVDRLIRDAEGMDVRIFPN